MWKVKEVLFIHSLKLKKNIIGWSLRTGTETQKINSTKYIKSISLVSFSDAFQTDFKRISNAFQTLCKRFSNVFRTHFRRFSVEFWVVFGSIFSRLRVEFEYILSVLRVCWEGFLRVHFFFFLLNCSDSPTLLYPSPSLKLSS